MNRRIHPVMVRNELRRRAVCLLKTRGQNCYEEVDDPGIYECEVVVHIEDITIRQSPEYGFSVRQDIAGGFPATIYMEDPGGLVLTYDTIRAPQVLEVLRRHMVLDDIADV